MRSPHCCETWLFAGNGNCPRKNLRLMHKFIKNGLPDTFAYGRRPINEFVRESLFDGETTAEWMKWMVKGRFNLPTAENPPHHMGKGIPSRRRMTAVSIACYPNHPALKHAECHTTIIASILSHIRRCGRCLCDDDCRGAKHLFRSRTSSS